MSNQRSHVNENPRDTRKTADWRDLRNNGVGEKNKFAFQLHPKVLLVHYNDYTITNYMCV